MMNFGVHFDQDENGRFPESNFDDWEHYSYEMFLNWAIKADADANASKNVNSAHPVETDVEERARVACDGIATRMFADVYEDAKLAQFMKWCIEDSLSSTGAYPNHDEFWAYYHAAHVYQSGGPLS